MLNILLFSFVAFSMSFNIDCSVDNSSKIDCGKGDQTSCENAGCCWKPLEQHSVLPWCYYPAGTGNCFLLNNDSSSAPFSDSAVQTMTKIFFANLDIDGKGGVCASQETTTPCSGSYYYHWERDGALSMRAYMTLTGQLSDYEDKMKAYVQWILNVQSESDPHGIDVRVEPKFELPNGDVYAGGWCRPQTDGPALRSTTVMLFANEMINAGQMDYVKQYIWTGDSGSYNGGLVKYDLDWVKDNWNSNGCDLWEEVRSTDFFWNRINFKKALLIGADFATKMGDSKTASEYTSAANDISNTLMNHYQDGFVYESTNRQKDSAVILGFNDGYWEKDGMFAPTSKEVAGTIKALNGLFCTMFDINMADTNNNIPGVMYGRYMGDSYCGGNPWILNSAGLATLFYRGALFSLENGLPDEEAMKVWGEVFGVKHEGMTHLDLAQTLSHAGDSVLKRLQYHVASSGYHLSEQLDRNTGKEASTGDLTWSYANVLLSMYYRTNAMKLLEYYKK